MDYWAKPGLDRHQTLLFCPTLDECIGEDHPVRHLDEVLRNLDWSAWEQGYDLRRGSRRSIPAYWPGRSSTA